MEKEAKRKKQKSLIKKVLIGIGIAGVSILTIRAIIRGKHQQNKHITLKTVYSMEIKEYYLILKKMEKRVIAMNF